MSSSCASRTSVMSNQGNVAKQRDNLICLLRDQHPLPRALPGARPAVPGLQMIPLPPFTSKSKPNASVRKDQAPVSLDFKVQVPVVPASGAYKNRPLPPVPSASAVKAVASKTQASVDSGSSVIQSQLPDDSEPCGTKALVAIFNSKAHSPSPPSPSSLIPSCLQKQQSCSLAVSSADEKSTSSSSDPSSLATSVVQLVNVSEFDNSKTEKKVLFDSTKQDDGPVRGVHLLPRQKRRPTGWVEDYRRNCEIRNIVGGKKILIQRSLDHAEGICACKDPLGDFEEILPKCDCTWHNHNNIVKHLDRIFCKYRIFVCNRFLPVLELAIEDSDETLNICLICYFQGLYDDLEKLYEHFEGKSFQEELAKVIEEKMDEINAYMKHPYGESEIVVNPHRDFPPFMFH